MTIAALLAALALIVLTTGAGRLVVRVSALELSPEETFGWSWGAGSALLAAAYAVLLAVGARPGPKELVTVLGIATIAAFARPRARGIPLPRYDGVAIAALVLAAGGVLLFALPSVAEPLWSTDFLAIWGLKGKTIFFTGAIPGRLFHDPATFWSHPEYPLYVPLAMSAFSAATGSWNDETLGLLWATWQIATVLAVTGYCRRRGAPRAGAVAAAAVALFHPLYRSFGAGVADVPLAFAAVLLAAAAADRNRPASAIACLLVVSTKQEGTLLAILTALLLLAGRTENRPARRATAAVVVAVAAAHFLLLRTLRGAVAYRDFTISPLLHPAELAARVTRLIPAAARSLSVPLAIGIAGAAAIFLCGRRSSADALLGALGLQVAAYLAACALSAFDPVWQFRSAFLRTSAALVPAVALLLAARLAPAAQETG